MEETHHVSLFRRVNLNQLISCKPQEDPGLLSTGGQHPVPRTPAERMKAITILERQMVVAESAYRQMVLAADGYRLYVLSVRNELQRCHDEMQQGSPGSEGCFSGQLKPNAASGRSLFSSVINKTHQEFFTFQYRTKRG
jgi:hypothetical protein